MMRFILLVAGLCTLSACEEYQAPRANCFSFAAADPNSSDCIFAPLGAVTVLDIQDD